MEYGLIKPQCTGKSGYRTAAVQRGDMEKVTSILHGDTAGQDRQEISEFLYLACSNTSERPRRIIQPDANRCNPG